MKRITSILTAIVVISAMSITSFAAGPVYPNGGVDTAFNGESVNNNVNVTFAYENGDEYIPITNWEMMDGYSVDITWGDLNFLFIIDYDDAVDEARYVSKWNPDELRWMLWDKIEMKEIDAADLHGYYDYEEFVEFAGTDKIGVYSANKNIDPTINPALIGINGFAITNRSSQNVTATYTYHQIAGLYDTPSAAIEEGTITIGKVVGQVDTLGESEAVLTTAYNYLNKPNNPPENPGIAGTITITLN